MCVHLADDPVTRPRRCAPTRVWLINTRTPPCVYVDALEAHLLDVDGQARAQQDLEAVLDLSDVLHDMAIPKQPIKSKSSLGVNDGIYKNFFTLYHLRHSLILWRNFEEIVLCFCSV